MSTQINGLVDSLHLQMSASDSAPTDKSRQVFCIPELVSLIAGFCEPLGQTRLLCTCKKNFKTVLPSVWGHVSGVVHLLVLLEGAVCEMLDSGELDVI
ncbi:hypothetical protein FRC12_007687, partial [Ceratobasidium sp. 428]